MDEQGKYTKTTAFVMGTRWDRMPPTRPAVIFTYVCAFCKATTYTEKEYPKEATVICNDCAALSKSVADKDPKTDFVWDLPPEVLDRLLKKAAKEGIPPENYIIGFFEWKTGLDLPQIRFFNREDAKIYIIRKR